MPDFVSFLLFAFTLAIKRRNFVFENHGSTLTVLNKNDMMSDLNIYWGKMYDCVSVPFFGFTLVIKPRNFDFESHWNILIFSDKKKINIGNDDVSSGNTFELHWRPSDKLLKQTKSKRRLRIDPCRTPGRTLVQDKCWPFGTTLCFHNFKNFKLSKETHSSHVTPIYEWGLYVRTCQMPLKYLKAHQTLHSLDLNIDKYRALLTKDD